MKTNYSKTEFLVLTNEDSQVMAIIKVQKCADITEQVRTAISESYDAEEIKFDEFPEFDKYTYEAKFRAEIIRDQDDSFFEVFDLTLTTIY